MPAFRRVPGGVICGGFTDHHVHLQLVDAAGLEGSLLGRVVDLGGDPAVLASVAVRNSGNSSAAGESTTGITRDANPAGRGSQELRTSPGGHGVEIRFAGAFLTPPGGYPSDRAWAPAGSVREIGDADAAAAAVTEMTSVGASFIKVASNSTAGPVFSDDLFRTIVDIAAASGLPVVAHAEGPGEAERAARLGARMLAHAPFSERLTDDEIAAHAASVQWISTLAIHDPAAYGIAIDNVRRFHAAGGRVLYGTDMGNGPTPVGLNAGEVQALRDAGLDDADLLRALAPQDVDDPASLLLFLPGADPDSADPLLARPLTPADPEA